MKCSANCWISAGAILGGLAVVLGAFAAHGLDSYFAEKYANAEMKIVSGFEVPASWKYMQDFKTGCEYQMTHALALLAVGILGLKEEKKSLKVAGYCFTLGIVLFSGTLYLLTLTGQRWLGAITPIGGTLLIIGWVALAMAVCPCKKNDSPQ